MIFNAPLNKVSFGNVAYNLLKELIKTPLPLSVFPIGQLDLTSFKRNEEVESFLKTALTENYETFNKEHVALKLWHINGLQESIGLKRAAITFHETSTLTNAEINILGELDRVFVTSKYTKSVFESAGLPNVVYMPLGFDSENFRRVTTAPQDAIVFGLFGKSENRKNTLRILNLWAKKFGNNKKFSLICQISNPFIHPELYKLQIQQALGGKNFFNISFMDFLPTSELFNELINAIDIDLTGMSSGEGFNLPAFNSLCLGKQGIFLNAHAHKDFVTKENAILVEPCGMRPAEDGLFFIKGQRFNQGEWFEFKDDEFVGAMESAVQLAKIRNLEGEKLASEFTYEKSAKILTDNLNF